MENVRRGDNVLHEDLDGKNPQDSRQGVARKTVTREVRQDEGHQQLKKHIQPKTEDQD